MFMMHVCQPDKCSIFFLYLEVFFVMLEIIVEAFVSVFCVVIYYLCPVSLWCPSVYRRRKKIMGQAFLLFCDNGSLGNCLSNLVTSVKV